MDLITENLISLDQNLSNKEEIIHSMVELLNKDHRLCNETLFIKDLYEREQIVSTAIGDTIAIPHAISCGVQYASLVFIKLNSAVLWNTEDYVKYVFGIAVPKENPNNQHLKILSSLARKMLDENFKQEIFNAHSAIACLTLLSEL